jgi:hypothetical protein
MKPVNNDGNDTDQEQEQTDPESADGYNSVTAPFPPRTQLLGSHTQRYCRRVLIWLENSLAHKKLSCNSYLLYLLPPHSPRNVVQKPETRKYTKAKDSYERRRMHPIPMISM